MQLLHRTGIDRPPFRTALIPGERGNFNVGWMTPKPLEPHNACLGQRILSSQEMSLAAHHRAIQSRVEGIRMNRRTVL